MMNEPKMSPPMDDEILMMLARFRTAGGASSTSIRQVEQALGLTLPDDFAALLQWSNGGEGPVGESGYLQLWPIEQIEPMNDLYSVRRYLPMTIAVGTNLGGNAYWIDLAKLQGVRLRGVQQLELRRYGVPRRHGSRIYPEHWALGSCVKAVRSSLAPSRVGDHWSHFLWPPG